MSRSLLKRWSLLINLLSSFSLLFLFFSTMTLFNSGCGNSIVMRVGDEQQQDGGVHSDIQPSDKIIDDNITTDKIKEKQPIDESFCCTNGAKKSCYTGALGTAGKGICKKGIQTCQTCIWSPCVGQVIPKQEICADKLDNDCDGLIDEPKNCLCHTGSVRNCSTNKGICKLGKQTCIKGKWSACVGGILPKREGCDGKDNDCDGLIDEGNPGGGGACRVPHLKGACVAGITMCVKAVLDCIPKIKPTTEICDKKDNDCDGLIDEGGVCGSCFPQQQRDCYVGTNGKPNVGICRAGRQSCTSNRKWGACIGQISPRTEICDKLDNDCDGLVDEGGVCGCKVGQRRPCYIGTNGKPNVGICRAGIQSCASNGKWGACVGQISPRIELCNGVDDDCDGAIDEKIYRPCYAGLPKYRGIGACQNGRQTCNRGQWSVCIGYGVPKTEVCDSIDNDCDGTIDEGNVCVNPGKGPVFRMNTFAIAPATEGFDLNGDGKVDNSLAILGSFVNKSLNQSVQNGSLNILLELAKLADHIGRNGAATIYLYMGKKGTNGYWGDRASLNKQGKPLFRFAGLFKSSILKAGPGVANLMLPLFGSTTSLFRLEHSYLSFQNVNLQRLQRGYLAGAIPARYLDQIPATQIPIFGGPGKTLLDVLVNLGKQPDVDLDNDGLERFIPTKQTITSCKDGNGFIIQGGTCALNSRIKDGYSITFKFTAIRTRLLGFR